MIQIDDILIDLCGHDFLEPYIRRALGHDDEDYEKRGDVARRPDPVSAVSIRSDAGADASDEFDAVSRRLALPQLSIYCPVIVGTGMIGLPRRMAASIYRGSYFNIKGNESRISVIHASDLARAVALAAGTDGAFTITDGAETAIDDFASALSYRLGDKRLFTLNPWMARIWYGKEYYGVLTSDHLASDSFGLSFPSFHPVTVTEYLRTHVYDEKSL